MFFKLWKVSTAMKSHKTTHITEALSFFRKRAGLITLDHFYLFLLVCRRNGDGQIFTLLERSLLLQTSTGYFLEENDGCCNLIPASRCVIEPIESRKAMPVPADMFLITVLMLARLHRAKRRWCVAAS